jgi:hypothetical protein
MEKLTSRKKLTVVKLYLEGLSYDEIAAKSGVAKGTVANLVAELKSGIFPEATDVRDQIDVLREVSVSLKHTGQTPGQCAVGLAVLDRLRECDLEPADIDRLPLVLKTAGNEEEAKEFVDLVYRIHETLERSGLSLEEVDEKLHDMEIRADQLEPAIKQVEELEKEITDLTQQRHDLAAVVNSLEQKYNLLNPRVNALEKRESELTARIKDKEKTIKDGEVSLARLDRERLSLENTGFSMETLSIFNDRIRSIAAHHKLPVENMKERLFHDLLTLDKGLGLEGLVQNNKMELRQIQKLIVLAKKESEALQAGNAALEQHQSALETSSQGILAMISKDMTTIVPVAKETVERFRQELHAGNDAVLDDIQHLRDQTLEVGKEIGRYETIVKENEWLLELLSLAQGRDDLKTGRIKVILLRVLRGAYSVMKVAPFQVGFNSPTYATGQLIEVLEKWETK